MIAKEFTVQQCLRSGRKWDLSSNIYGFLIYTFKFPFIKNAVSFSASLARQGRLSTGLQKGTHFSKMGLLDMKQDFLKSTP